LGIISPGNMNDGTSTNVTLCLNFTLIIIVSTLRHLLAVLGV